MKRPQKTLAFYVEVLLLTLFLLLAMALLARGFATAADLSRQAAREGAAALLANNATAAFLANDDDFADAARAALTGSPQTLLLHYTADGFKSDDGPYTVRAALTADDAGAGQLLQGEFAVFYCGEGIGQQAAPDDAPLLELTVKRYCPAAE